MKLGGMKGLVVQLLLLYAVQTAANPVKRFRRATEKFDHGTVRGTVKSSQLDEISGVAASRRHEGILYVINDSGDSNRMFAIDANTGETKATFTIKGIVNCDWEDLAIGPGPYLGMSYIYIGDVGGNAKLSCQAVYRIEEPDVIEDAEINVHGQFRYSWAEANCETLLVSPKDASLYLVSKSKPGTTVRLYPVPETAWDAEDIVQLSDSSVVTLELEKKADGPVAGDISPDGQQILLKTYNNIYLYTQSLNGETVGTTLAGTPDRLYYNVEKQGESIAWEPHGEGFYTISEGTYQDIFYYGRCPIPTNKAKGRLRTSSWLLITVMLMCFSVHVRP